MRRIQRSIFKRIKLGYRYIFNPRIIINNGIKIHNGSHITGNIKDFIYRNAYENSEFSILQETLSGKDKVLEIGAGLGYITIACAKFLGEDKVIAYEANPKLIEKIGDNCRLNHLNPTIRNTILSDGEGNTDFYIENQFWSSSFMKRSSTSQLISVPKADVNKAIEEFDANFLIIDIEGGEKELIPVIDYSRIQKILIELHPQLIGNRETTKIFSHLYHQGFSIDFKLLKKDVFLFMKEI